MPRGEFYQEYGGVTPEETQAWTPPSAQPPKGGGQPPNEPSSGFTFKGHNIKTVADLAAALLPSGGITAGELEYLISPAGGGVIDPEFANQAMVLKDSWLHQMRDAYRGGGPGIGNNLWYQQAMAGAGSNPWGAGNLSAWMPPADIYQQYTNQPVMGWQPGALPEMYRNPAESWLRGRGFTPTGSLGVYGYTGYKPPSGFQSFNPAMLDAIPDEGLRKWLAWYMSRSGLMAGNYPQP